MIKSKPAALPLYYVSTHSLMAVVVLTVEVTLPATPPAVSSGTSATLRLPLSIITGDVLQTHVAERPRGRACPVCSQLNMLLWLSNCERKKMGGQLACIYSVEYNEDVKK